MDDKNKNTDPGQRKWDNADPSQGTGRAGGKGGERYNEGPRPTERDPAARGDEQQEDKAGGTGVPGAGTNAPPTDKERRFGGSHTAGKALPKEDDSEMEGGTPKQGPTTGGMGAAGGGHDTDETDVWGDKDKK